MTPVPHISRPAKFAAVAAAMLTLAGMTGAAAHHHEPPVRFMTLDVYIDAGANPIAAYQVEIFDAHAAGPKAPADASTFTLVGVEGGEHPAYKEPPYYDPAALSRNIIKLAALSTADDLPKGRTRMARLHVQVTGAGIPEARCTLQAAGDPDGKRVDADATAQFLND